MQTLRQIIIVTVAITTFHACNSNSRSSSPSLDSVAKPKTVEDLKQELKEKEQSDPAAYLTIRANLKENITQKPDLFHHTKTDGYFLAGLVKNSASIAKFKDAVYTLTYLSDTDSEIESKEITIYKFFNPNSTTEFEEKVYPPSGFKNFKIQIKTATPVN